MTGRDDAQAQEWGADDADRWLSEHVVDWVAEDLDDGSGDDDSEDDGRGAYAHGSHVIHHAAGIGLSVADMLEDASGGFLIETLRLAVRNGETPARDQVVRRALAITVDHIVSGQLTTQKAIADALGCSRWTVYRLRAEGIAAQTATSARTCRTRDQGVNGWIDGQQQHARVATEPGCSGIRSPAPITA